MSPAYLDGQHHPQLLDDGRIRVPLLVEGEPAPVPLLLSKLDAERLQARLDYLLNGSRTRAELDRHVARFGAGAL